MYFYFSLGLCIYTGRNIHRLLLIAYWISLCPIIGEEGRLLRVLGWPQAAAGHVPRPRRLCCANIVQCKDMQSLMILTIDVMFQQISTANVTGSGERTSTDLSSHRQSNGSNRS